MSAEFPNDFKETVRAQTDIVQLIGESIALSSRSGGRELVGLCPFHDDHNPSMRVYPDRQTFRCWVCQTGGDCFTFVMEHDKLSFREALELLAQRANIPIPQSRRSGPTTSVDEKATLLEALAWACNQFHTALLELPEAEAARKYLQQRGYTEETVRKFRLGYHPDDWQWLLHRARGKFSEEQLLTARLIARSERGRLYDYFRGRVLFPILNERAQPVAFGGRILPGADGDQAKYFNSPESPVFHKSRLVYGLSHARDAIRDSKTAVVVEGYTDCITCHQAGLNNVVGTLGTALTEQHVTTIKRFAPKVVLIYDGDDAGQMAAERAVERFLAQDVDLRILTLPGGQDPAEFLGEHGVDALQSLVAAAPEAWEYKMRSVCSRVDTGTIAGRQRVLEEMIELLACIPEMARNVRESLLIADLSTRLSVSEQQVREQLRDRRNRPTRRHHEPDQSRPQVSADTMRLLNGQLTRSDRLELELLENIFVRGSLAARVREEVPLEWIRNTRIKQLLAACYHLLDQGRTPDFETVMLILEDPDLKRLAVWIDEGLHARNVHTIVESGEQESPDGCPLSLRRSIDMLKWRRDEESHGRIALQLSAQREGTPTLDEQAEDLLRQATEFHQRRATKRAPLSN
ncbi:DNA primase [Maioricimonas sp. JC845]|uniref:DNA primase n=1 Tax=Maioricimonas sp. JC845 TaxID=3232138 RepID=UPI003457F94F